MGYSKSASERGHAAVAAVRTQPFWLDVEDRPAPLRSALPDRVDLVVVGAGFTGLWTAINARLRDPGREVLLVDGARIAEGAAGRNGGFMSASLTHGLGNGLDRWPHDMPALLRMGHDNLAAIAGAVAEWEIDCDLSRAGEIDLAITAQQAIALRELADAGRLLGEDLQYLGSDDVARAVRIPSAVAGLRDARGVALVNPARLAWGLARVARELGVSICEQTPVDSIRARGDGIDVSTRRGTVGASRVALCTGAFPSLLRRVRHYIAPVYDYAMVTEPLTDRQWAAIGWDGREGLSDSGNQFHYFRPTPDGRILWGGFDAVHHSREPVARRHETDRHFFPRLAEHFFQAFPALEGLSFTHGWGGAIDTCSRFTAFWDTTMGGRVGYVAGHTGLGVGASRFGALTLLDLLDGADTERTRLEMVRTRPVPFPPEPLRSAVIGLTAASMQRADDTGRRNAWLRTLDRMGLGFDS